MSRSIVVETDPSIEFSIGRTAESAISVSTAAIRAGNDVKGISSSPSEAYRRAASSENVPAGPR
jgi:hypothetical protein